MAIGGKHEILLVQKGQLIQVSEKRSDGWWYGRVVFDPKSKMTGARSADEFRVNQSMHLPPMKYLTRNFGRNQSRMLISGGEPR